jgi:hypothetical protein
MVIRYSNQMVNKIDCWSKGVQPTSQRYCLQNLKLWVYTFKTVQDLDHK